MTYFLQCRWINSSTAGDADTVSTTTTAKVVRWKPTSATLVAKEDEVKPRIECEPCLKFDFDISMNMTQGCSYILFVCATSIEAAYEQVRSDNDISRISSQTSHRSLLIDTRLREPLDVGTPHHPVCIPTQLPTSTSSH